MNPSSPVLSTAPDFAGKRPTATLYLHIPFCLAKCGYCSFNSYPAAGLNLPAYLEALRQEVANMAKDPWVQGRHFTSLYFGGGTPTIYSGAELAGLVEQCLALYNFSERPEISIEANPNTLTRDKLSALHMAGVNRLSIGIQSFNDRLLKTVGRTHKASEGTRAVNLAQDAGFANLSIDLIYGLPGQGLGDWIMDLDTVLALGCRHFSFYELMVEEKTPLANALAAEKLQLPDEKTVMAMETETGKRLPEHGFTRYEISSYGRPGHECRHNLNYWKNGSYLGLGAGAVSCLSGLRISNVRQPDLYVRRLTDGKPPYAEAECLAPKARFRETVVMGLRMIQGVDLAEIEARFSLTPQDYYGETLKDLRRDGLIEIDDTHLRLTGQGLRLANQVSARLV